MQQNSFRSAIFTKENLCVTDFIRQCRFWEYESFSLSLMIRNISERLCYFVNTGRWQEDLLTDILKLKLEMLRWYQETCDTVPRCYDSRFLTPESIKPRQ